MNRRLSVACLALFACQNVSADERRAATPASSEAPPAPASAPVPLADAPKLDASTPDAAAAKKQLLDYKNVLHVGDSTVGYTLGVTLEYGKMFKAGNVKYESRTVTAAGLNQFNKSKVLEKLVKEKDPDLVIIQLGTNNLTVPTPSAYLPDVKAIVAQAGGKPCYWIGPIPLEQPEHGMRAMLRENVAPCVFYDSFDLKLARQEDKIHPTQPAAKKWADAFWKFANEHPAD